LCGVIEAGKCVGYEISASKNKTLLIELSKELESGVLNNF
jgi:hypothetical protein